MSESVAGQQRLLSRAWNGLVALWGVITGLAPHVLHHVGPLAGGALLSGATGRATFAVVALVVSIPLLLRLRRRSQSWVAPAIALVVFVVMFLLSSLVVGPAITTDEPDGVQPNEHEERHDQHR